MSPYHWKYSGFGVIMIFGIFGLGLILNVKAAAWIVGQGAATISDVRFLAIGLIGFFGLPRFNPIVIGVFVAAAYKALLFVTLQDHWASLGINPSWSDSLVTYLICGVLLMSVMHLLRGWLGKL